MTEYISRQAAFAICDELFHDDDLHAPPSVWHGLYRIKQLPAADVRENVKGEWIWNPDGMDWGIGAWVCSECGSKPETWWESDKNIAPLRCSGSSYCPNCGADMRKELKRFTIDLLPS